MKTLDAMRLAARELIKHLEKESVCLKCFDLYLFDETIAAVDALRVLVDVEPLKEAPNMFSKEMLETMIKMAQMEATAAELALAEMVLPDEKAVANAMLAFHRARVSVAQVELEARIVMDSVSP